MTRQPVDLPMIDTALLHLIFSGALDTLTAGQVRVINDRLRRLDALEAAARRVSIAWPYFQELTDYVEFESAMHDLTMLVEEVRP